MTEELFPEVSNWTEITQADERKRWHNNEVGIKLRVRHVDGPFRPKTSTYIVEQREYDDDEWEIIDKQGSPSKAKTAAYEYAKAHNEVA